MSPTETPKTPSVGDWVRRLGFAVDPTSRGPKGGEPVRIAAIDDTHTGRLARFEGHGPGEWDLEFFELCDPPPSTGALKFNSGKPQPSLVSARFVESVARALEFGAAKYGRGNYRQDPRQPRHALIDAALRHIGADVDNPHALDPESGLPHLWHAAASLAMLLDNPAESPDPKTTQPNEPKP